jgi:gliding motility-associated-like protein
MQNPASLTIFFIRKSMFNKLFNTIIFLFSASMGLYSQNLVPNPDFELYDICPTSEGQILNATAWQNLNTYTPDYYNSCSANPRVSVPYNWAGYQQATNGNAYAGIFTFETPLLLPVNTCVREYIGSKLNSPLIIGKEYVVSFIANLALDSSHRSNQATNKLGVLFSTTAYDNIRPLLPGNFAHVYSQSVISDTANWTTVSGSFIADSAYQYINIGNFFDDARTMIIPQQDTIWNRAAYYYIDDVRVFLNKSDSPQTENHFFIPNSFTPNSDRLNDILYIKGTGLEEISFRISDRWGTLVFSSTDINKGWDGRYRNKDCPMGVYSYFAMITYTDGKTVSKKGVVTLVR